MITKKEFKSSVQRSLAMLKKAKIVLTPKEKKSIEVVDVGLSDLKHAGLQILVYVNTKRCCAKELIMFPGQTCTQHRHPSVGKEAGKEETFRCRYGEVYLYLPGKKTKHPKAKAPKGQEKYYTVWNELILKPGEQYTLSPNTWHWFQAGPKGAVVSEFSTRSTDEHDIFLNPNSKRETIIK